MVGSGSYVGIFLGVLLGFVWCFFLFCVYGCDVILLDGEVCLVVCFSLLVGLIEVVRWCVKVLVVSLC